MEPSTEAAAVWDRAVTALLLHGTESSPEVVTRLLHVLENDRAIGIAVGVLMAEHQVSQREAAEMLSDASRRSDRPLAHVAREVVARASQR
jgi:AmiR/NasT family two-component response regulator